MRLRPWLGLLAVITIAAGSVVGALLVRSNDNEGFQRLQREEALRSARQVETVAELSTGQLVSAAALYSLKKNLSQHDFEVLSRSLLRESGISAVAVAIAGGRCCPIGRLAAEGSAPQRQGFDLTSSPAHAAAIARARDERHASATSFGPTLIGHGSGVAVYYPSYRDGVPLRTVKERRAALIGFAVGAFSEADLAAAATTALPADIETQLLEGGQPVIGASEPLDDGASAPVRIADQTWLLLIRDPNRPSVGLPILMAVFGISIAALLGALVLLLRRSERMQELQRQAHQDSLTGLKNRRRFEEDLHTEMARSRRDGVSGAVLMLDLDNFKRVNDTYGHAMGDQVIGEIAGVLRGRVRETDVLARLGGDEFAIALPRCTVEEAHGVATEIATAIRKHAPESPNVPKITASVGIAMFGPHSNSDLGTVMASADSAMYEAKDAGRDAVRVSLPGSHAASGEPQRNL